MPLPGFIAPQLATAREDVPTGEDWVHEIKFDGYRMLAYVEGGSARLLSRNTLDWSRRFGQVTEALADIHAKEAIIDGEVCVLDERGRADFQKLQALVEDGKPARLSYLVFDLLWLDGEDLRRRPLMERKAICRACASCGARHATSSRSSGRARTRPSSGSQPCGSVRSLAPRR